MSKPTYSLTPRMVKLVAKIAECLGTLSARAKKVSPIPYSAIPSNPVYSSQMMTGNTQLWELIDKSVNKERLWKVHDAAQAYTELESFSPYKLQDLQQAHRLLMMNLVAHPGQFRSADIDGQYANQITYAAPLPGSMEELLQDAFLLTASNEVEKLLQWLRNTDEHPLIAGCVLCFQLECIQPFHEGNTEIAILWESLLLFQWKSIFLELPIKEEINNHQQEYHTILEQPITIESANKFVEFMLERIHDACKVANELKNDQESDQVNVQVKAQVNGQDNDQVKVICSLLKNGPLSALRLMRTLKLSHRANFRKNYLIPALNSGLVERTIPHKPTCRSQKYRLVQ